ncbi:MAG TPA: hypothetical protein VKJ45_00290 [Blastocatellia bacterium]|nr:hypothetical protein [Blastocatellia bacterium]
MLYIESNIMRFKFEMVLTKFALWCVFLSAPAFAAAPTIIDLRPLGYPNCDYLFQAQDAYAERHVEFLDSQHLIVKFPVSQESICTGTAVHTSFRSVVVDLSGRARDSKQWDRPAVTNVQAGPDGRILEIAPGRVTILDASFEPLQTINLSATDFPNLASIEVSPARHGFAVIDSRFIGRGFYGFSAYFDGPIPVHQSITQNTDEVIVGDGALIPFSRSIEVGSKHFECPKGVWIALPADLNPVCLTSDFQLVQLTEGGGQAVIANVRDLAPGWNSGLRYLLTGSQRILLDSHGVRFPLTDTSGIGYYRKVAIWDLRSQKEVFRRQFSINSDVAISPDGNVLAVQEKSKITLYPIQEHL